MKSREILWDDLVLQHENPAIACGIDENDGLVVAWLPRLDGVMQEHSMSGGTVFSMDGRVIDVVPGKTSQRAKWWTVKQAARNLGMNFPEPIWQGRAGDFTRGSVPDVPRPLGHKLYMRCYSHGPWIRLEKADAES